MLYCHVDEICCCLKQFACIYKNLVFISKVWLWPHEMNLVVVPKFSLMEEFFRHIPLLILFSNGIFEDSTLRYSWNLALGSRTLALIFVFGQVSWNLVFLKLNYSLKFLFFFNEKLNIIMKI